MNPVWSDTFEHPDQMGKNSFDNSKLKLMQNINREYLEDIEVELPQS